MTTRSVIVAGSTAYARTHRARHCVTHCVYAAPYELAAIALLYIAYQVGRGLVGDAFSEAQLRAHRIAALEREAGVFWEASIQAAVAALPAVPLILSFAYVSLHVGVTASTLWWLYRRHPSSYATARTMLILGTALALAVHITFPTAPPRLAELGIADTVETVAHIDLNSQLLGPVYNPIAAVPSMHFGYAVIVGYFVATRARRRVVRWLGTVYAPFVLVVIVATGNHFFFDAAAGLAVVGAAALVLRSGAERRRAGRREARPSPSESLGAGAGDVER